MSEILMVSNATYRTAEGDLVPRAIAPGQSITYSRSISFWPWSTRGGGFGLGSVTLDNTDGAYDTLIDVDMRYQFWTQYRLQTVAPVPLDEMTVEFTGMVDTIDAPDIKRIRIALDSPLRLLDKPMLTATFDDTADESLENRPQPMLIGLGRNIPAVLWRQFGNSSDPIDYRYQVADVPVSGIANVRDRGFLITPGSAPPLAGEWAFDSGNGNKGFYTASEPVGIVTCDASTTGDVVPLPPSPTDALQGYGDFETAWDFEVPDPVPGFPVSTGTGQAIRGSNADYAGTGHHCRIRAASGPFESYAIRTDFADSSSLTLPLEAGKQYRWSYRILGFGGGLPALGDKPLFTLRLHPANTLISQVQSGSGLYSGIVTIGSSDQDVLLTVRGTSAFYDLDEIEFIEIEEVPVASLGTITLRDYVTTCVNRASQPDDIIDTTIDSVDPSSDGLGFGVWLESQITALGAVRLPLPGFNADIYPGRDGKIKFAVLRDPEETSSSDTALEINQDNIVEGQYPTVRTDRAPGLTTVAGARRNYYVFRSSDFVDNPEDVPLSLRETYGRDYQFIVTATGTEDLPGVYAHALDAEPLETYFDDPVDAQAQLQAIVDLYRLPSPRHFVDVQVWLDESEQLNPDDIVVFRYPRYSYTDGVRMLVVSVAETITSESGRRRVNVTLWGV